MKRVFNSIIYTIQKLKIGIPAGFLLYIGLLVLLIPGPGAPLNASELKIQLPGRTLTINSRNLLLQWKGLALHQRLVLAPYLIEYGMENPAQKAKILELMRLSRNRTIRSYGHIARVYFSTSGNRYGRLAGIRSRVEERRLVSFFLYLESPPNRRRAADLKSICRVAGQQTLCELVHFKQEVARALSSKKLSSGALKLVLRKGSSFLGHKSLRPPFFQKLAGELPERLYSLGLPLEAAILSDRLAGKVKNSVFRRKVLFYLSSAADFESANRYAGTFSHPKRTMLLNARLDWLILGGKYRKAAQMILRQGPKNFTRYQMRNHKDYWTSFSYTPAVIRLRLALLLYLAGDIKKAVKSLENLNEFSGVVYRGEPEKYFARLRLAQILVRDNPELAHKIAEDISYIAQEKDWRVLEYHATVLDGWANYFRGSNYKALIAFTKSGGILKGGNRAYSTEYSRLMGFLAVKNKMRPGANHGRLIARINKLLQERPFNEAIFTIREWLPRGTGPDFFIEQAMANQNTRRDKFASLNLLLEFSRASEHFFNPGKNPGGVRGFLMSVQWSREMSRFSYMKSLFPHRASLTSQAAAFAEKRMPRVGIRSLRKRSFSRRELYLFSFPFKGGQLVQLVHPVVKRVSYYKRRKRKKIRYTRKVRTLGITSVFLKPKVMGWMKSACTLGTAKRDCNRFAMHLKPLARMVRAYGGKSPRLRIMYSPELDLDYKRLLGKSSASILYFYSAYAPKKDGLVRGKTIYRGQGCSSRLSGAVAARPAAFSDSFSGHGSNPGAVWIWPVGLNSSRTSRGNRRPVYLRNFICGSEHLRFWEMDRFSGDKSPGLVVYHRRPGEADLNRAFARHFSERGTALAEVQGAGASDAVAAYLNSVKKGAASLSPAVLAREFRKNKLYQGKVRVILPYIFD